jgi:hypothetical protein
LLSHAIDLELDIEAEPLREIGEHEADGESRVIHVVNIDDFEALEDKNKPTRTKTTFSSQFVITLILSIVIHVITFYIISLRIQLPSFVEEADDPIIVQAKLYTPPPTLVTEPEIAVPVMPEPTLLPEVENPPKKVEKPDITETREVVVINEKQTDTSPVQETITNQSFAEQPADPITPQTELELGSLYNSKAVGDLKALEQKKLNSMTNEAVKELQYRKTHPKVIAPTKKELTHAQKIQRAYTVEFECNSTFDKTAGKVLRLTSGFLHGTKIGKGPIGCHRKRDIGSFIKNRLDKKTP